METFRRLTMMSCVALCASCASGGHDGGRRPTTADSSSYEAEAPANTLSGGASVAACSPTTACSGGARVIALGNDTGQLRFNGISGTGGTATLTFYFTNGLDRALGITYQLDSATAQTLSAAPTGSWDTVASVSTTVTLASGAHSILVSQATDIDRLTVSSNDDSSSGGAPGQLSYETRAVGNEYIGGVGPHMQNHVADMNVLPDGTCVTHSVWDEGGHPNGKYKDGAFVGSDDSGSANSQATVDNAGKHWTIARFYGRFVNQVATPGGDSPEDSTLYFGPVPTGSAAPLVTCEDGRTIPDVVDPTAIGINYGTGELYVAENGPDQNVRVYDISGTPRLTRTIGVTGGVFSGTPGLMNDPLRFLAITGVGGDAQGNSYVALGGFPSHEGDSFGSEIRSFTPDGTLRWRMRGYAFVAAGVVDPTSDGTQIFDGQHRYTIDYGQKPGQDWESAAMSIDPFHYPDDPRLVDGSAGAAVAVKYINGGKFLFVTNQYHHALHVFRFNGEIAIPAAVVTVGFGWNGDEWSKFNWQHDQHRPTNPRWIWSDANGDGQVQAEEFEHFDIGQFVNALDVDDDGSIYMGGDQVWKLPIVSFDSQGTPQYRASALTQVADVGHPLHTMKWVQSTDTFVSGNDYAITSVDVWEHFSDPSQRRLARTIAVPQRDDDPDHQHGYAKHVTADSEYAYVTYGVEAGPFTKKAGEVVVASLADGHIVGYLTPGPEVGSQSGWIDMDQPTNVFVRASGERVITVEEDWAGKILVYRWCPSGSCQ